MVFLWKLGSVDVDSIQHFACVVMLLTIKTNICMMKTRFGWPICPSYRLSHTVWFTMGV